MNKGLLLVVSGPAGVGKGTVVKKLLKNPDYAFSVSATTRRPRPGEKNGVNYYFISEKEFQKKIQSGEMLEYAEYVGHFYGTPRSFVNAMLAEGRNVLLEIDTAGALQVKTQFPESVLVFISPPTPEELEARLRRRGTEEEGALQERLKMAAKELALVKEYDYVIVNSEHASEKAAKEIEMIVFAEKHSVKRGGIKLPKMP